MTDKEALKEIDRQEKRFAAAKCGRGLQLAKSAAGHLEDQRSEAAKSVSAKPEILLIGDSIRIGYCGDAGRELGDFADYCHFTGPANRRLGKIVADFLRKQL